MTDLFVDSSAWIALADAGDNDHAAAVKVYPRLLNEYRRLVITSLVVAEVYTFLRYEIGARAAFIFLESIHASARIEHIPSTVELEYQAESILRRYEDQDFSYTDAVSFALMQARKITHAFTFDKHFVTMGFQPLPLTLR